MPIEQAPIVPQDQSVLATLDADLTEEAVFGHRTLTVTAQSVVVTDPAGTVLLNVPVEDLRAARNEPLVSGGRLQLITKKGEEIAAITYSQTRAHLFSEIARGIEQLAEGKPFNINLKVEKTRCDSCGRLLPEKDGICPYCINRGKTMLRIMQFLKPYRKQALLLMLTSTTATLINLIPPNLQGHIIDSYTSSLQTKNQDVSTLYITIAEWVAVIALGSGIQILNGRTNTWIACHISSDLRTTVYRAIEFLQLNYFDKKPLGAIGSRVTQDTDRVWGFLVDGLPFFINNSLTLVAVAILIAFINPWLALAILIPVPMVALISTIAWKPVSGLFFRVSQKWGRVHMHLSESLNGIRVVKAFAKEDHEYERFKKRSEELRDAAAKADMTWYTAFGFMSFCVAMGTVIHWMVGGYMLFHHIITLGQFWKVGMYLGMVYGPLQWFAQLNNWFSRAMAGAERIFEIMDMTPEPSHKGGKIIDVKGEVEFDGVRFGYDKSNPVINGVSFTVKAGEMIGLVGHSGAGKSTTINLIARFYEPDAGEIKIDGIDYRELDLRAFRSQVGIVLQEPFLFHGTIAENIKYGNPNASMEEVMASAKAANAHDFILSKPDGYDTLTGERGSRLSGGEKQRISIARAILHNPKILILDEATSSVDVEAERSIQQAIQRLIAGRTTFAIAHRLSTLRNADRLIVLDRGAIAEMGTHEELMAKKGSFYKLVQTQTQLNEIIGIGAV